MTTEWHKATEQMTKIGQPPETINGHRMNRTVDWVIERASARIAQRVPFAPTVSENDVLCTDAETGESMQLLFKWWGHPDNSDRSVHEKINRTVDRWLEHIARRRKETRAVNAELDPAETPKRMNKAEAIATLPAPAPRKKGRPKKQQEEAQPEEVAAT